MRETADFGWDYPPGYKEPPDELPPECSGCEETSWDWPEGYLKKCPAFYYSTGDGLCPDCREIHCGEYPLYCDDCEENNVDDT